MRRSTLRNTERSRLPRSAFSNAYAATAPLFVNGKPFEGHQRKFQALVTTCRVLPVDETVAEHAATIWAGLSGKGRRALGDILIAATASARGLPLVTRNRRDFVPMARIEGVRLSLVDWTR